MAATPQRKKRSSEERKIQAAVWQHFQLRKPKGALGFAVPNGGTRNLVEAVNLKRTGAVAGVADMIFVHMGHAYALEIKTETGRPTASQLEFMDAWREAGGFGCIANGLDRALACLKAWGLIR